VEVKYGNLWGGWCSEVVCGLHGVSLWKFIRRGWDCILPFLSFNVGDGGMVQFWHDLWCADAPLKVTYPELFVISGVRDAFVAELMSFRNGSIHWDLNFLRNVQDWELDSMTSFLDLIYSVSLEDHGANTLCWLRNSKRGFSVKLYYCCLSPPLAMKFPWKGIWKPKVPSGVSFFT
jgi:hypothetical protein